MSNERPSTDRRAMRAPPIAAGWEEQKVFAPPPVVDEPDGRGDQVGAAPPGDGAARNLVPVLRLVSAEIRDLQSVLRKIRDGEVPLARFAEYIRMTHRQVDELLGRLPSDEEDDCLRHVRNAWEQMSTCPLMKNPDQDLELQDQLQYLALLDEGGRRMVYWTASRTVPHRLANWLAESEPGYAIPFHAVFDDEIPDPEDRQKLLNHIAWSPRTFTEIGGIVDAASGLVFRFKPPKNRREALLYNGWPVLLVIGLVVASGIALHFVPVTGLPQALDAGTLVAGWAAVLAGLLIHVMVGMSKRSRAEGSMVFMIPPKRLLQLLATRWMYVSVRVGLALFAYLGLLYTLGPTFQHPQTLLFNALLVGYSLDSFVDLFGKTLDQRAAAQHANLSQRLGHPG